MSDFEYPHVVDLTYRIETGPAERYVAQATLEGELREFRFRLNSAQATFWPLRRFETDTEARAALDPHLRAWEFCNYLKSGPDALKFAYVTSQVRRAAPRPNVLDVHSSSHAVMSDEVKCIVTRSEYPPPPSDFAFDECVQDLASLFVEARKTPNSILKDAYSFATRIEFEFGGFRTAAKSLGISESVFGELRKLSTTRGVGAEVRKFEASVQRSPLTAEERSWIMRALEATVRRMGARAANAPIGDEITVNSLRA